jgi:hypothetical protein
MVVLPKSHCEPDALSIIFSFVPARAPQGPGTSEEESDTDMEERPAPTPYADRRSIVPVLAAEAGSAGARR